MHVRGLLLVCASLVLAAPSGSAAELTPAAAWAAAQAAARYMISVETAEGRFLYQFDFLAGRFSSGDNIVRQVGGAYGLGQYVSLGGDAAAREPARRALDYARGHSVAFAGGLLVSGDNTLAGARIGATALAVLAAAYQLRMSPDETLQQTAAAWVRGIAAAQRRDGLFPSPPAADKADSYASGEAWYALARWVDLAPEDGPALRALKAADAHLMPHFLAQPDRQFFHWGLMAATQRAETSGDAKFLDFIEAMGETYLTVLAPAPSPGANTCAAVEGLAAGLRALNTAGRDPVLRQKLRSRINVELTNSLALQIQPGQTRIAFGPDRFYEDPKIANFAGGFRNGAASLSMRIDATQHCLGALLAYRQLGAD